MKKTLFSSGAKWEDIIGYSRAVRHGNTIEVSGSTSLENGKFVGKDDIAFQTRTTLNVIKKAITALGGEMKNVIRTRIYVTDISLWEEVGKVHGEFFGDIKPATSMVQITALIDPDMLVEIEATAIVDE